MRIPSRTVILVVLMASLILPPGLPVAGAVKADPAGRPATRILLVGDSLSIGLGKQLETTLAGRPEAAFAHLGKVSSGLANPAFFNWDVQLTDQVRRNHPDLVLIMLGANDNKPLPSGDGRSLPFGSRDWEGAYAARLTRLHAIVKADNPAARVYFLGVPIMADPAFDAEMIRVNAVLAATARTLSDTAFIPTRDVLADAAGGFAPRAQVADGSVAKLRADDGVHISGIGARLLAARCLEAVDGVSGLPTGQLLAGLDQRGVHPVGTAKTAKAPVVMAEAAPTKAQPSATEIRPAKAPAGVVETKPAVPAVAKPVVVAAQTAPAAPVVRSDAAPAASRPEPVKPVVVAAQTVPAAPATAAEAQTKPSVKPLAGLTAVRPASAVPPASGSYAVADGDTLWSVAKRLGVTPERLAEANPGVDPRRLSIGQPLAVPGAKAASALAARDTEAAPVLARSGASRRHVVADGDNFWSVARRHDLTVAALTQANPGVDPTRLRIGQTLNLPGAGEGTATATASAPAPAHPARGYTVADGDNFWSIARRLNLDVAALKRANTGVDPQKLQPGQVLALPVSDRAEAEPAVVPAPASTTQTAEGGLYPVAKGDTLWALARRFGVSLETMLTANGELDPVHLRVGQLVTIPGGGQPVAAADVMLFPVSLGDTLWGIARRFDVSVEALVEANPGVDPLRLREGQTLRVPSSLAAVAAPAREAEQAQPVVSGEAPQLHSVLPGDTLWDLSRRFGVSVERILEANAGIDPVRLRVGQTLRLPGAVVSMAAR